MKTNVFLNTYKKKEDELTYAFFSMLEIINSKGIMEFLTREVLSVNPILNMRLLPVGNSTNPDGEILLEKHNGDKFKLLFENKTKIRSLDKKQLLGHLSLCSYQDRLLVITPRKSDISIINEINDHRVIFYTWSEVASELFKNHNSQIIAQQFIEYGKISGQFEELGEVTQFDIDTYIKYIKIKFDHRIQTMLAYLAEDLRSNDYGLPVSKNDIVFEDNGWGRNGIEFGLYTKESRTYGQWYFVGLYYDSSDHGIKFKKDIPEIALFFDINPLYKAIAMNDKELCSKIAKLEALGFENNIDGKKTSNEWRFLYKRIPIDEFELINPSVLKDFIEKAFDEIRSVSLIDHKYFKELNLTIAST